MPNELTAHATLPPTTHPASRHPGVRREVAAPFVIVLAAAFVLVLGGATAAALLICGWGNVQSVSVGWLEVVIECKQDPSAPTEALFEG